MSLEDLKPAEVAAAIQHDDAPSKQQPFATGLHVGRADRRPMYRVVEVMRDDHGHLLKEGHVWHDSLERARRFGRVLAANTSGHAVVVEDAIGRPLETLLPVPPEQRTGRWDHWADAPLPPLPPRRASV